MPWICLACDSCQNSGVNSGAGLPGYSAVRLQDIRQDWKYREMRDFNMAERQQIRSKLKNVLFWLFT